MKKLFSFDVVLKDLECLSDIEFNKFQSVMKFIKSFWFEHYGSNIDYLNRIRVGTFDIFLDHENHLHLDFITRFSLSNYPKIIKFLQDL